ncbi:MAG: hypothetical protein NTW87_18195 [Planctomycetota bacterium]|nr:hypothetical protein [Planctomycetota bacterium]
MPRLSTPIGLDRCFGRRLQLLLDLFEPLAGEDGGPFVADRQFIPATPLANSAGSAMRAIV